MRRIILLRSRRFRRVQRSQALQHAVIGFTLLLTGFDALRSAEPSRLLAGFELLTGALLFLAAAREVRGKHRGGGTAVSIVDILAGVAATAEGLHRAHGGSHGLQFAYYAIAAIMLLRGVLYGRLVTLRRLELDSRGFFLRTSIFRTVRGRWRDLDKVSDTPQAIDIALAGGARHRLNLTDLENAEEVRAAFLGYRESLVAVVREVSPRLAACELTHLARQPIDYERARDQHAAYVDLLASLGCAVRPLPPAPDQPDSVFVEDTAVVLDELAIVTRPGAASRRVETATVDPVLREYRPVRVIAAPGTLDGGDVLVSGKQIFIGLSSRSNQAAVEQVRQWVEPAGYQVHTVGLTGCLHLKSAATEVGDRLLLVNPAWVDPVVFAGLGIIEVDPDEPQAANALRVGGAVVYPVAFPATRRRLETAGVVVHGIDLSELAKAEGAVTCCSLVFRTAPGEVTVASGRPSMDDAQAMPGVMPTVFVSHGAPTLAIEEGPARTFLLSLACHLPRPRAILCVSAHWDTAIPAASGAPHPETIHDFFGFPEALYQLRYQAPGSPELAARAMALLLEAGIEGICDSLRGIDHGAWVPLRLAYPDAQVPVVQLSVQSRLDARHHLALGRALRPLREEGVLILGSGGATHNLRDFAVQPADTPPYDYAREFDDWLREALLAGREADLLDYVQRGPQAMRNHPTAEHFLPLFVALGAATDDDEPRALYQGIEYGMLSMAAYGWFPPGADAPGRQP